MVKVTGSKKLQMYVISDVVKKEDAFERMLHYKKKAFGVVSSLMTAFQREADDVSVGRYQKRYEPFWYLEGESFLEYVKKTKYKIPVGPRVRKVEIAGKFFDVENDDSVLIIDAQDHCFDAYKKSIVKNAAEVKEGKESRLETYRKAPSMKISSMQDLQKKDVVIVEPHVKVSSLIRTLIKELIRSFDGDKIVHEKVHIPVIALYFRPVHVFELKRGEKTAALQVDAITGAVSKTNSLASQVFDRLKKEQTWFDVGTELASAVVPGAGAGVVISKHIKDRFAKKKNLKMMRESQEAQSRMQ